jgi:hypothetical protein
MKRRRRPLAFWSVVLAMATVIGLGGCAGVRPAAPRWEAVSYDTRGVDSLLTHSGRTVAAEIVALQTGADDGRGRARLQGYLEPFSTTLPGMIATTDGDSAAWRDLRDDFPPNAPAPAWVGLLREGRLQVVYTGATVRIFAPGATAEDAWREYGPIVRLVLDHLGHAHRLEIYAFTNDYAARQLRLCLSPRVISRRDLASKQTPLNLPSLQAFLASGAVPEALEIGHDGGLRLYGRRGAPATLAGKPLELADLAAAYRAVFWCGEDQAYVSLDGHEDRRFAKVNFGGSLANTRLGQTALQADRTFKAIGAGLDPNTLKPVLGRIRAKVPDFLPASALAMADKPAALAEYRYWFYPDSLAVVTDGSLGAVANCRFVADVERREGSDTPPSPALDVMAGLNRHHDDFAAVLPVYTELENAGRLLLLMSWLKTADAARETDLAGLLAVDLPPLETPRKVPRVLSATTTCRPDQVRVFAFAAAVGAASPSLDDAGLLKLGEKCFAALPESCFAVKRDAGAAKAAAADLSREIKLEQARLRDLEGDIDRSLRRRSDPEAHEKLVAQYNARVDALDARSRKYESLIAAPKGARPTLRRFVVSGGIDLALGAHLRVRQEPDAFQVRTIRELESRWEQAGAVSTWGEWVRSEF